MVFLYGSTSSFAQKTIICEFADTTTSIFPDSALRQMAQSASDKDSRITPEIQEQLLAQMKNLNMTMSQVRIVKADKERTIIKIDRSTRSGNLTMETFDSLLYKDDEIFMESATTTGFSTEPSSRPKKEFLLTGKKVSILNYQCEEYLSTDSTCFIWVTRELPDYINPGLRRGNVKGAVPGFQLKAEAYTIKCVLAKFGRGL